MVTITTRKPQHKTLTDQAIALKKGTPREKQVQVT